MAITRQTHTVALLGVTRQCYDEVKNRLKEAMYDHVFADDGEGEYMDMSGIALTACIENDTQFLSMDTVPLEVVVLVKLRNQQRDCDVWPAFFYAGKRYPGYRIECPFDVPYYSDIVGWMHLPK